MDHLPSSRPDSPSGATILLVDDERDLLDAVADLLMLGGYRVLTASDGLSALALLQHERPDLILSDITMPNMNGFELFEIVRSNPRLASVPFIFVTARGQPTDIRTAQRLGVDAYITKPFEPEDLLLAVANRLKRTHEIRASSQAEIDAMKQQLIMVFSHELRTPLTYIYGYVNLLEDRTALDEATVDDMLRRIKLGADRLGRLVDDLMLMVRIDSGVVALDYEQRIENTDLAPRLKDVIDRYAAAASEHRVELTADVPAELPAYCVPWYIENAFGRLLDNAVKFCKREGGHVCVEATRQDGSLLIRVEDDGIGIAPSRQAQIFEPLRQLDREVMEQQGCGLGLAIARSLIRLQGGDIEVDSAPGVGSVFSIHMPVAAPSQYSAGEMDFAAR